MTVIMQFQSQLEAVDRATPRERMGRGKISPILTQAPGPQVDAKKKMYMQMREIWALTADGSEPLVTPMMAQMNSQMSMPRAPQMRRGRRPNRSMVQNESGVEQTFTSVVMSDMRKGLEMLPRDCYGQTSAGCPGRQAQHLSGVPFQLTKKVVPK
jgi:hypothetical protein